MTHRIPSLLLLCCSFGCGGGERPAASAAGSGDERPAAASSGEDPAEENADSGGDGEAAPEERKARCDDGTCTPCGDALCPSGWYCDESGKGGPACGWLPECAKTPSCACVKRAFSGCACEEQGGAAHLSCK